MREIFRYSPAVMLTDEFYVSLHPQGERALIHVVQALRALFQYENNPVLKRAVAEVLGNVSQHGLSPPEGTFLPPFMSVHKDKQGDFHLQTFNYTSTASAQFMVEKLRFIAEQCSSHEAVMKILSFSFAQAGDVRRLHLFKGGMGSFSASRQNFEDGGGGMGLYGLASLASYKFDPVLGRDAPAMSVEVHEVTPGVSSVCFKAEIAPAT